MRKTAVWLFAGGAMQRRAAQRILEDGYHLILTDRDPACPCAEYATEFVEADTFDVERSLRAAGRLRTEYDIRAVVTVAADCHETVAHAARSLGLPGISCHVSRRCRYKALTREALSAAGLPQPRFATVGSVEEARTFIQEIGPPVVLKASNNSGSRGLALIGGLDQLDEDVFEQTRAAGTTGRVLVEEKLVPKDDEIAEQSVETVWRDGEMYWLNWVDRIFRSDVVLLGGLERDLYDAVGWGVELGHINPAVHEYRIKREVFEQVRQAGLAIGMGEQQGGHILKADIMLTRNGPLILELAPRLSGGWDSSASTPARGADFVGGALQLALGRRLDLGLWHLYFEYRNPSLFAAVVAEVAPGAKDCIGRTFALGTGYDRAVAVKTAIRHLRGKDYVV